MPIISVDIKKRELVGTFYNPGHRWAAHRVGSSIMTSAEGSSRYPGSRQMLVLADTGGSNGCRCRAWKTELQMQLVSAFSLAV